MVSNLFQPGPTQKLILFQLSITHVFYLAIPIQQVYKILKPTSIYGSGRTAISLTHVAEREVIVLDLHRHFYHDPQPDPAYLLIVEGKQDLMGIPLPSEPLLIEVPTPSIRIIPERFRQIDILGLAHHVVQVSMEQESLNTFIVNRDALEGLSLAEEPNLDDHPVANL